MGDRGNIVLRYSSNKKPIDIYLYTHWNGSDIGAIVQRALAKQWRWTDGAYLARIIFDELIAESHGKETGYGIAPWPCDNEHDFIVVDFDKQKVIQENQGNRCVIRSWSFNDFIKEEVVNEVE
jgi:hypothetical protein